MNDQYSELRPVELRIILHTEMSEEELEKFCEEIATEVKEHLIDEESVLGSIATDKISYESKQLLKQLGVK